MRSSTLCALLALCSVSAAPRFDEAYVRARIISTEALTRGRSEMPVVARPVTAPLPAAFDARTEWSNCTVRPPWPVTNSPATTNFGPAGSGPRPTLAIRDGICD